MENPAEQMQVVGAAAAPVLKEAKPRGIRVDVLIGEKRTIAVYTGKRVADALSAVADDMTVWKAVKLTQVLEAVYDQGKKDGARCVFDSVDALKAQISHRNPGKPRKHGKK